MTATDLWPLVDRARRSLGSYYDPAMEQAASESGLPTPEWYSLFPALTFDPETVTVERMRVRNPYTAPKILEDRLARLSGLGALTPSDGGYRLTKRGSQTIRRIIEAAHSSMAALTPMASADLQHLTELLQRLVESCLAAPEPPGKWCLSNSRAIDPGDDANVLVRLDQYVTDLAAWQRYAVSGPAWEAFTLVWRGEASTPEEVHSKLVRRGYSLSDYAEELSGVAEREWIVEESGTVRLTAQGQNSRQEAEETTDRYYYAPWAVLSEAETGELRTLLNRLSAGLSRP